MTEVAIETLIPCQFVARLLIPQAYIAVISSFCQFSIRDGLFYSATFFFDVRTISELAELGGFFEFVEEGSEFGFGDLFDA